MVFKSEQLDAFGPTLGRGAVWLNEPVTAGEHSEPFLFSGFERRSVHLTHDQDSAVTFWLEVDETGMGDWDLLRKVEVPATGYRWVEFPASEKGAWIRLRADRDCSRVSAMFTYSGTDNRVTQPADVFDGVAELDEQNWSGGLIRARGDDRLSLHFAATKIKNGKPAGEGYYEMGDDMKLMAVDAPKDLVWLKENVKIPTGVLQSDAASVLVVTDGGLRYRLPKGSPAYDEACPLPMRIDREVCTERDLFNAAGTFYELPAENAGGFAKVRPVTTHNRRITDYCSWRGLLVLSGISAGSGQSNSHIIRSDDGNCALWVGAVDDLWQFGKAVGQGGPWKDTAVKAGEPSDPYLMTGYDGKTIQLSHNANQAVKFRIQVDITGNGDWQPYREVDVAASKTETHRFPDAFQAYWVRVVSDTDCQATAWLTYE